MQVNTLCNVRVLVLTIGLMITSMGCDHQRPEWWSQSHACNLSISGWSIDDWHSGFGDFTGRGLREVVFQDSNHVAVLEGDLARVVCERLHGPYADQLSVWHDSRTGRDRWVALEQADGGFDLVLYGVERKDPNEPSRIEELGRCALNHDIKSPHDLASRNRWISFAGDSMSRNVVVYVSGPDHRGPGHVYVVDPFRMVFCHDPIPVNANISAALYLGDGTLVLGNQVPDSINGYISAYDTIGALIWSTVVGGFASGGRLYPVPGRSDLAIGLISHQNERDSLRSTLYLLAPARGVVISRRDFVNKIGGLVVFGTTGESGVQILAFPDSGGICVLDSMLSTVQAIRLDGPLHEIHIPRSALDQLYRPVLKGSNELLWLDRNAKTRSVASIPPLSVCKASPLPPIDNKESRWFLVGYGPQSRNAGLIAYATLTRIPPYRAIAASGLLILVVLAVVAVLQQRRAHGMMQYVAAFRGLDEQGALGFSRDGKLLVCLGIARRFCEVGHDRRRGHWHEVIKPTFTGLAKAIATLQSSQSDFERSFVLTDRSDEWVMLARGKLVIDPRSRVQRILYLSPENQSWRRLKDETYSVLHDLKARLGTLARAFEKQGMERDSLAHVVPELQEITESLSEVMKLGQFLNPRQDPIDLTCTVEAVVSRVRAVFPQVTWVFRGDGRGVIYGDERLIKRLLSVLLYNAAEALVAQDESKVTISVYNDCYRFDPSRPTLEQPAIALEVADNGPGMPPEVLSLAFAKPVSSKGDTRGHGLLDVRKIVDAHAAGLVWSSTTAGTVFRIYFQQLTA